MYQVLCIYMAVAFFGGRVETVSGNLYWPQTLCVVESVHELLIMSPEFWYYRHVPLLSSLTILKREIIEMVTII